MRRDRMSRIGEKNKSYGLIVPSEEKAKQQAEQRRLQQLKKPSVFADADSDDDSGGAKFDEKFGKFDARKAALEASGSSRLKSATRVDIDKCLAEDPSIFEYDAIYDKISAESEAQRPKVKTVSDRAPKYIGGLMQAASERKMEREYQKERKIQAEREAEEGQFADKEAFVTGAYKRRLEEFQALERQHRLQEVKDARQDAAKQADLSGFYRNLLDLDKRQQQEADEASAAAAAVASSAQKQQRQRGQKPASPPPKPGSKHRDQQRSRQRRDDRPRSRRSRSQSRSRSRSRSPGGSSGAVLDPLLLIKLRRRNDADSVSEARQRFLQRKGLAAASLAPPIAPDSEDDD